MKHWVVLRTTGMLPQSCLANITLEEDKPSANSNQSPACVKQQSISPERYLLPGAESPSGSPSPCVSMCTHGCLCNWLNFITSFAKIQHVSIKWKQNMMRFSENILSTDGLYPHQHSLWSQHTINHYETFSFILTPKRNWKEEYFWMGMENRLQQYLLLRYGFPRLRVEQELWVCSLCIPCCIFLSHPLQTQ